MVNDRLFEMMITPRASIPTKSSPTPVSSPRRDRRFTRLIPPTMIAAVMRAPTVRLNPHSTARAIPGITPWASASPRKLRPRSTTHVPTTDEASTASIPASRARCMNSAWNGSSSQDMGAIVTDQPRAAAIRAALVRTICS